MQCSSCSKPADKETFPCDICKNLYCLSCSGVCQSEVRVLQLKNNRILNLICKQCKFPPIHELLNLKLKSIESNLLDEIKDLHKEIRYQDEKLNDQMVLINRLVKEVTELKEEKRNGTYADIVRNKSTSKSSEVIVVKPKEKQQSDKTKNDIKEKIDPKRMAMAVENIKFGKEGSVIINCSNSNTKEKIKETVESELGNKYSVVEGKQKNPKVIIRGVEEEFVEGEDNIIIEALKEQNEINIDDDITFTVHSKYKQKGLTNKGNIVLNVEADLKNKLCQMGKLNIGWRRCVVHEFFRVIRCFKCARYGHMAASCENNVTCFKCAESHKSAECTADFQKCINCVETNNKFKKSLNTDHTVTDNVCPCYQRIINLEEKKTKK